jgi:hypothetical protein
MKKLLLLALVGALLVSTVPVLADDGFYVIPTRATPGTSITYLPYTITAPGYYFLNRNLTYAAGYGITIDADNVILDLMGFCLTGPSTSNSFYGILIHGRTNVEVRNGTISGWKSGIVTYEGGSNLRVIGIRANGNTYGIYLGGTGHLIKGCSASPGTFSSGAGLVIVGEGTISNCMAMNFNWDSNYNNSGVGIFVGGGTVSDSVVINCTGTDASGIITQNGTVSHNSVINCTTGIQMIGGSLIGNAISATSGQTALKFDGTPVVADQNSFDLGAGANYYSGTWAGTWGVNGGATPPTP